MTRSEPPPRPLALLAELTHACPLRCAYCSNPLELVRRRGELGTAVWKRVLVEAAALGVVQVHFSGGEPLLRRDLAELVEQSVRVGLYPYLITSGVPSDAARFADLHAAGLPAVQVSLQAPDAAENDALAGTACFAAKLAAVEAAKRAGMHVALNVVLHRGNVDRLPEIVALAERCGVDELELAHVQYRGWAFANRAGLFPTEAQLELAIARVAEARRRSSFPILHVLPEFTARRPNACLHGWGRRFLTVAPDGAVLPCQTARDIAILEFPNVLECSLSEAWHASPVFERYRGTGWMSDPCRTCPLREVDLGGCRCQAFLVAGDAARTDPACELSPVHEDFARTIAELRARPAAVVARHAGPRGAHSGRDGSVDPAAREARDGA